MLNNEVWKGDPVYWIMEWQRCLAEELSDSVYSWLTILSGHMARISRMRIIGISIMSDSIIRHQHGLTSTIQVTVGRYASTVGRDASIVGTTHLS